MMRTPISAPSRLRVVQSVARGRSQLETRGARARESSRSSLGRRRRAPSSRLVVGRSVFRRSRGHGGADVVCPVRSRYEDLVLRAACVPTRGGGGRARRPSRAFARTARPSPGSSSSSTRTSRADARRGGTPSSSATPRAPRARPRRPRRGPERRRADTASASRDALAALLPRPSSPNLRAECTRTATSASGRP